MNSIFLFPMHLLLVLYCVQIIFVLPFSFTNSAEYVIPLTTLNFNDSLKGQEAALVKFYAPWCGYCKQLAPTLEGVALKLQSNDKIKIFKVDCQNETELCSSFKIPGYPTLKIFKNGEFLKDFDDRDPNNIQNYLLRLTKPANIEITSLEDLKTFSKENDIRIIGLFDSKDTKEATVFNEFARLHNDLAEVAHATFSGALDYFQTKSPAVYLLKPNGEKVLFSDGELSVQALKQFVLVERLEPVGLINTDTYGRYLEANISIVFIFYLPEKDNAVEEIVRDYTRLALKFKNQYLIGYINAFEHNDYAKLLGLPSTEFPAVVVHDPQNSLKYPLLPQVANLSPNQVEAHLDGILKGTVKPNYKSAPIPEGNGRLVKEIVTSNFGEFVMDEEKDVLVDIYAPWCGACQKLAPMWQRVALHYEKYPNKIAFGKLDSSENEIPRYFNLTYRSIPAVYLYPAGKGKKAIKYEEDKFGLEFFFNFIKTHGSHQLVSHDPSAEGLSQLDADFKAGSSEHSEDFSSHEEL